MIQLFPAFHDAVKTMVFIDGENLALRYADELKVRNQVPITKVSFEPNVFVWSLRFQSIIIHKCKNLRTHYYTSVQGDNLKIEEVIDKLRSLGIEQPSVFKKEKGKHSKRVDVSLSTDMLWHAAHRNYETAVLVAGDEDYVPLINSVKAEGCRVIVWFIDNGLSASLKRSADYYFSIGRILFDPTLS